MIDLQNLQNYREDSRIEAKQALGGLPESIWETYSAFANAEGGVILLGVEELPDKSLHALDLLDPHWLIEDFWQGIQDPALVSVNILAEEDVQIHTVQGRQIVVISVPPAPETLRPVYVRQEETWIPFFRRGEGDFRCTDAELTRMYREREAALNRRRERKAGLDAYLLEHYRPRLRSMAPMKAEMRMEADCAPVAGVGPLPNRRPLRELVQKTDAGFSETLLRYIDRSGRKDSEVYSRANLSRQHFSKIRNNPNYRPTKTTALALAVALKLSLEETKDLIGRAGYALTRSSKLDVIVMYFLEQGCYDLGEINEALYEYDQSLLGG